MARLGLMASLYGAALRGQLAYRVNFLLLGVLGVVYQGSGLAFIWVLLSQVGTIGGWTFDELFFLYSMRMLAHAAWVVPFNQLDMLSHMVREGRLDVFLVRPVSPLLQVLTHRFQLNVLGDAVLAVVAFVVALGVADIELTPLSAAYLVLAVLGGAMAEGAVVLAVASLNFRYLETEGAQRLIDNVYLIFGSYPLHVFGATLQWTLTWLVPVAFVAYLPAATLLGRPEGPALGGALAWAVPAVGAAWFALAHRVWGWQLNRYQSAGH